MRSSIKIGICIYLFIRLGYVCNYFHESSDADKAIDTHPELIIIPNGDTAHHYKQVIEQYNIKHHVREVTTQ